MSDVQLTSSLRSALDATQQAQKVQAQKARELATGRRDTTALKRAQDYVAQSLSDHASDLLSVKDTIQQAASKSLVAQNGLDSIDKTLDQLKSLALQYQNATDPTTQAKLQDQFDSLSQQIDNFANDSSYGGTNLISQSPDTLTIPVSSDATITVQGQASDSGSLNLDITNASSIDLAKQQVRDASQSIGSDASALQIQQDFTDNLVNQLQDGAAKLVNTDLNEAAASSLSASTLSQLSVAVTALAAQSDRAILQLFNKK